MAAITVKSHILCFAQKKSLCYNARTCRNRQFFWSVKMDNHMMSGIQTENEITYKKFPKFTALLVVLTAMVSIICAILFVKLSKLEADLDQMKMYMYGSHYQDTLGADNHAIVGESGVMTNAGFASMEGKSVYEISADSSLNLNEFNDLVTADPYEGMIKVCFTFDDGPSANTDTILDILDDYGVKATFFVNGKEGYDEQYLRIVTEGHTIGMHSYSHNYRTVYGSLDSFADDLYAIQTCIKEKTGVDCKYYRFPGGSSNAVSGVSMEDCISYLNAKGVVYYDWNVSAQDAVAGGVSTTEIVNSVMNPIYNGESDTYIILFHDAQDKNTTVEALPIIIEKLADMENVVIVPIDQNVTPVQHVVVK